MNNILNVNYYPSQAIIGASLMVLYGASAVLVAFGIIIFILVRKKNAPGGALYLAIVFFAAGLILFGGTIFFENNPIVPSIPSYSNTLMLQALWASYKTAYIEPSSGRTFDPTRDDDTTSEAEGYTMLRAVWMGDETTFDSSWSFTENNLQRPDHLFSWLYGPLGNGSNGIINTQNGVLENGYASASDADTDIALSLVFAYARWQKPAYLEAAVPIIKNIWSEEVWSAGPNGAPYLAATALPKNPPATEAVDPSYFTPYAYRIFAKLDPADNWSALIDTSYQVLDNSIALPIDQTTSAYLPPDWIRVDAANGNISAPALSGRTTDFGYDAIRVPWRIAIDWEWNRDPRAQSTLSKLHFLTDQWRQYHSVNAVYEHDGTPVTPFYQSPATYGGIIGYYMAADPANAQSVYDHKLLTLFDPDSDDWKYPMGYYNANIAWFGMALYTGNLPNLFMNDLEPAAESIDSRINMTSANGIQFFERQSHSENPACPERGSCDLLFRDTGILLPERQRNPVLASDIR